MKLLLEIDSDDEYLSGEFSYAIVDIDAEYAAKLLGLIKKVRRMQKEDSDVVGITIREDRSKYYIELQDIEDYEEAASKNGYALLGNKTDELLDFPSPERLDASWIEVVEYGVRWKADPKWANSTIYSQVIPISVFTKVAKDEGR